MSKSNTEIYTPRLVTKLGVWDIEPLKFKVYGIVADGGELPKDILDSAYAFIKKDVPELARKEGQSNDLGFVVIHAGELGVSILAHWWIQGSVLCQHIQRTLWDADAPMNTDDRPVIACVWELALINSEQEIWRNTMMNGKPDDSGYINTFSTIVEV